MKIAARFVVAAGLATLFSGAAQAIEVVNISALGPTGTTLTFAPGDYTVEYAAGDTIGSLYVATNAWGLDVVEGCDAAGAGCTKGWSTRFATLVDGIVRRWEFADGPYASAAQALAAGITGPVLRNVDGGAFAPVYLPYAFTATTAMTVKFYISDSFYDDNVGGVSLLIKAVPAVPEPETVSMLLAGIGLLALLVNRRKGRAV